jgi:hypothetical protein
MTAPGAWRQGETCPKSRALATASIEHFNQICALDRKRGAEPAIVQGHRGRQRPTDEIRRTRCKPSSIP